MYSYITAMGAPLPLMIEWVVTDAHTNTEELFNLDPVVTSRADVDAAGINYTNAISLGDDISMKEEPSLNNPTHKARYEKVAADNNTGVQPRAKTYKISGNHDSPMSEAYLKHVDTRGEHPELSGVINAERPFPIVWMDYDNEPHYYIDKGHTITLMLSDRNDFPYPEGWLNSPDFGGHGSGLLTLAAWEWAKSVILEFSGEKNIEVNTHQGPINTTLATGPWEGISGGFHGNSGVPEHVGALAHIVDESTGYISTGGDEFEDFFKDHPDHTVVCWQTGHVHHNIGRTYEGRSFRYFRDGVEYVNCGQLTKHAGLEGTIKDSSSWFKFWYSDRILYRRFLHEPVMINNVLHPKGWYYGDSFTIALKIPIAA